MAAIVRPRKFEIGDLELDESHVTYADAVRCVETYWKQATCMNAFQRTAYLTYLELDYSILIKASPVTSHPLYLRAQDSKGNVSSRKVSWPAYLVLSTLYGDLPYPYIDAIKARFGGSLIEDHTDQYRRFYPQPNTTMKGDSKSICTFQLPKNVMARDTIDKPASTGVQQQNATAIQSDVVEMTIRTASQGTQTSPTATQLTTQEPWNIESIITTMTPKTKMEKKRASSGSESSVKRAKVDGKEILEQVNQQAKSIQQSLNDSYSKHEVRL